MMKPDGVWPWSRVAELQSTFFRIGSRALLWIDPSVDDGHLRWRFDFMDLGFCHCIEHSVPVHAIPTQSPAEAAAFVFGGHYRAFMREWHALVLGPFCECADCDVTRSKSRI
jgi:hypothetical protein